MQSFWGWFGKNWERVLTMLFAFVLALATIIVNGRQNKIEAKQEKVEIKTDYLQEQANANQYNAEVAVNALGIPATKPDWDKVTKSVATRTTAGEK